MRSREEIQREVDSRSLGQSTVLLDVIRELLDDREALEGAGGGEVDGRE